MTSIFGSEVGHFTGHLHFINSGSFKLSGVTLKDALCDSRAAEATVFDQAGRDLHTFTNGDGCNTTISFSHPVTPAPGNVVYVHIRLRACNSGSCSDAVWSKQHFNPD